MKPNNITLIFHKYTVFKRKILANFLVLRGMQIGKRTSIGVITCEWPNKILIGNYCNIQDAVDFRIWHPFNPACYIKLGNNVFVGHACEFVCNSNITIGSNCLIASNTTFVDTSHEYSKEYPINTQSVTSKSIVLEEDVWVGTSCVILQGVTIGKGAVIGAGSVVNKNIPSYEVWAGVPARFIKKRE